MFTWPLTLFLVTVGLLVGGGAWLRHRLPDLRGAVLELADGDLDGEERQRWLAHVVALARSATGVTEQWAGLLAAVSLEDRAAHAELAQRLGGEVPRELPPPAERELLHLGEPVLGHLLTAAVAEAAGERADARRWWAQVEADSRLEGRTLARELAQRALARLRD